MQFYQNSTLKNFISYTCTCFILVDNFSVFDTISSVCNISKSVVLNDCFLDPHGDKRPRGKVKIERFVQPLVVTKCSDWTRDIPCALT